MTCRLTLAALRRCVLASSAAWGHSPGARRAEEVARASLESPAHWRDQRLPAWPRVPLGQPAKLPADRGTALDGRVITKNPECAGIRTMSLRSIMTQQMERNFKGYSTMGEAERRATFDGSVRRDNSAAVGYVIVQRWADSDGKGSSLKEYLNPSAKLAGRGQEVPGQTQGEARSSSGESEGEEAESNERKPDGDSEEEGEEGEEVEEGEKDEPEVEAGTFGTPRRHILPRPVFAVVQVGSHQFKVSPGDVIYVEKLLFPDVNDMLHLNRVLMLGSRFETLIGRPTIPDAHVVALCEEQFLDAKVIVFKKKRRKNYRRHRGHRQELTRLLILDVVGIADSPNTTLAAKGAQQSGNEDSASLPQFAHA